MKTLAILSLTLVAAAASAHVAFDPPMVEAGTLYRGVLRVGHGCDGAPTTTLDLQLPAGTSRMRATAKPGWDLMATPGEVVWTAQRGQALDGKAKGEFPLEFQVPAQAGPLWIKVLQRCQGASLNWADVPVQGTSTAGMKTPAVLLQVMTRPELAQAQSAPQVEGGWVRATVPGQQASGAFMRITAREPMTLVGVSTPVAGVAEVHEMKMEGDVMRMRPVASLELPAGKAVDLQSGGWHVMLQELKQPLAAGSVVPLTLLLRDAGGAERRVELQLPVSQQPPAGAPAGAMHKH